MQIRDRIKEFRRVPASALRPNPKNWRTHPDRQRDALRAILAEVGYVDALLARELADGSLELIDGHLRAETTPDSLVPVLICELNDAEADLVLATFDPLTEQADANQQKLDELLHEVETDNAALQSLLDELAQRESQLQSELATGNERVELDPVWNVLIECDNEAQQLQTLDRLMAEGYKCRALIS